MKVVGHHLGTNLQNPPQVRNGQTKKIIGFQVLQITDMLAQKSPVLFRQADGVFEFSPQGQHRWYGRHLRGQENGNRHVSPGAPDLSRNPAHHAKYRIISPKINIPVMTQKIVGDAVKIQKGRLIVPVDGFLAHITAGHDQGRKGFFHEKDMQRRIGQHNAQITVEGRHLFGKAVVWPFFSKARSVFGGRRAGPHSGFNSHERSSGPFQGSEP